MAAKNASGPYNKDSCKSPKLTGPDKSGGSKLLGWMKRLKPKKSGNKNVPKKRGSSPSPVKVDRRRTDQDAADGEHYDDQADHHANPNQTPYLDPIPRLNDRPLLDRSPQTLDSFHSLPPEDHEMQPLQNGQRPKSNAPTLDTNPGTTHSDGVVSDGHSKAGTSATMGGGMSNFSGGGGGSIFTSSNHSSHSLSTTLTTIQSQPSNTGIAAQQANGAGQHQHPNDSTQHSAQPSQSSTYFTHQYPTTPASAVPTHLQPLMHVPTTYNSATANGLLSDNASVLTLASSSHRPVRRNSLDTNASIRAIAPSSLFGGSRESLPLSVLSKDVDGPASSTPPSTAGITAGSAARSISGIDRASVYSAGAGGVGAPALSSERNSIYAGKTPGERIDPDKSSMKSGKQAHSRHASITDK